MVPQTPLTTLEDAAVRDAEPLRSDPLVCEAGASEQIAFVAHVSDGYLSEYLPHGSRLIVVDGACGYLVYERGQAHAGVLRRGTLDAAQLAELNEDLLTQPWADLAGDRGMTGADAQILTYRRGPHEVTCLASCEAGLGYLEVAARAWALRLWASGSPLEDGVDLHLISASTEAPMGTPVWDGAATLVGPGGEVTSPLHIDAREDVARLRALRESHGAGGLTNTPPIALIADGRSIAIGVVDRSPYVSLGLPSYQRAVLGSFL